MDSWEDILDDLQSLLFACDARGRRLSRDDVAFLDSLEDWRGRELDGDLFARLERIAKKCGVLA